MFGGKTSNKQSGIYASDLPDTLEIPGRNWTNSRRANSKREETNVTKVKEGKGGKPNNTPADRLSVGWGREIDKGRRLGFAGS